jgi:hypothetical protein
MLAAKDQKRIVSKAGIINTQIADGGRKSHLVYKVDHDVWSSGEWFLYGSQLLPDRRYIAWSRVEQAYTNNSMKIKV